MQCLCSSQVFFAAQGILKPIQYLKVDQTRISIKIQQLFEYLYRLEAPEAGTVPETNNLTEWNLTGDLTTKAQNNEHLLNTYRPVLFFFT
jgi:hypothetical protein